MKGSWKLNREENRTTRGTVRMTPKKTLKTKKTVKPKKTLKTLKPKKTVKTNKAR